MSEPHRPTASTRTTKPPGGHADRGTLSKRMSSGPCMTAASIIWLITAPRSRPRGEDRGDEELLRVVDTAGDEPGDGREQAQLAHELRGGLLDEPRRQRDGGHALDGLLEAGHLLKGLGRALAPAEARAVDLVAAGQPGHLEVADAGQAEGRLGPGSQGSAEQGHLLDRARMRRP